MDGAFSRRAVDPSTPGTAVMDDFTTPKTFLGDQVGYPEMPPVLASAAHSLLHAFLLGLCILSLIALWNRAPTGPFVVFLVWTAGCYFVILVLAWHGIPRVSVLSATVSRLRNSPHPASAQTPPIGLDGMPFPSPSGPYQNNPPYRANHDSEYPTSVSHAGHTIEDDLDDDDEDRVEEEMSRRDISIVTVPRRKLMVRNPEPREPS